MVQFRVLSHLLEDIWAKVGSYSYVTFSMSQGHRKIISKIAQAYSICGYNMMDESLVVSTLAIYVSIDFDFFTLIIWATLTSFHKLDNLSYSWVKLYHPVLKWSKSFEIFKWARQKSCVFYLFCSTLHIYMNNNRCEEGITLYNHAKC